ncbi:MAG: tyrosyl-tRNA synthetase [Hyphomonadaceae bacterium]|nr:MAG: tyrosyl-tRNA synthetase [Hyphomonadaceae bacterium]
MPTPAKYKSSFVNLIIDRGQYYQASDLDALDAAALASEKGGKPLVGYIGFDCTAPSLHVGSLTQIFLLRRLQQCGGKPIALMGSGTTRIGDPSDKNEARPVLTLERIAENKAGIQSVFEKYIEFGANQAKMVDNIEWLENIGWLEMLAEIGRHFTINKMIALDIVKRRLDQESPITFLEFNYMLLQAYDFLELSRRYDCNLQMGGSDQWGNIIQGVELCRRADNKNVFALTQPLLMNAAGQKMGKTAAGAVWLNADMLSTFDFWQYWRNVDDADVGKLLRLLTELPLDEIARLEALGGAEINDAKKILAGEITALCHGREAADAALVTANAQFAGGGASEGLPEILIAKSDLSNIASLFVLAGLAESNGEAKRLAKGGGLKIEDKTISDVSLPIPDNLLSCYNIKLSLGKKRHLNVVLK